MRRAKERRGISTSSDRDNVHERQDGEQADPHSHDAAARIDRRLGAF
jgi:hypothetical protein